MTIELARQIGFYACAFLALTLVGNLFIRTLLTLFKVRPFRDEDEPSAAGALIGSLERIIIATGILAGSWEVLVAVVALKTVARYKEIDDRREAEYFLVGSLASLLWALAISMVVLAFDAQCGFGLAELMDGRTP
jgi:hypothetical protein